MNLFESLRNNQKFEISEFINAPSQKIIKREIKNKYFHNYMSQLFEIKKHRENTLSNITIRKFNNPSQIETIMKTLNSFHFIEILKLSFEYCVFDQNSFEELTNIFKSFQLKRLEFNLKKSKLLFSWVEIFFHALSNDLISIKLNFSEMGLNDEALIIMNKKLKEMNKIKTLTLNLDNNEITEEGYSKLISVLNSLKNLNHLSINLNNNKIKNTGSIFSLLLLENLQMLIIDIGNDKAILGDITQIRNDNLKSLSILKIKINHCKSNLNSYQNLTKFISNLSYLKKLSLRLENNFMNHNHLISFHDIFNKLSNLDFLTIDLSCNVIGDSGVDELTKGFQNLITLRELNLNLGTNGISDQGIMRLSEKLKMFINLTKLKLNLNFNKFNQVGIKKIFSSLMNMINLSYLQIDFERIKMINCNDTFLELKALKNLKFLDLGFVSCKMSESGIKSLTDSISNLKYLKELILNLYDNNINDSGVSYFSGCFNSLKFINTIIIVLSNNKISHLGGDKIFSELKQMTCLKILKLVLFKNFFKEGDVLKNFPETISLLKQLNHLYLDLNFCQLNKSSGYSLFKSILLLKQQNLRFLYLDLQYNKLNDEDIQEMIKLIENLKYLDEFQIESDINSTNDEEIELDKQGMYLKDISIIIQCKKLKYYNHI